MRDIEDKNSTLLSLTGLHLSEVYSVDLYVTEVCDLGLSLDSQVNSVNFILKAKTFP